MIRRPPRSTRTDTLFPTRRSSDLDMALAVERDDTPAWQRHDVVEAVPGLYKINRSSSQGNRVIPVPHPEKFAEAPAVAEDARPPSPARLAPRSGASQPIGRAPRRDSVWTYVHNSGVA